MWEGILEELSFSSPSNCDYPVWGHDFLNFRSLPLESHLNLVSLLHAFIPHALVIALTVQRVLGTMASMTLVVQHVHLKMRSLQAWFLALCNPMTDPPHTLLWDNPELASQLTWWCSTQNLTMEQPFQHAHKSRLPQMPPSLAGVLTVNPYGFMYNGHKEKSCFTSMSWSR